MGTIKYMIRADRWEKRAHPGRGLAARIRRISKPLSARIARRSDMKQTLGLIGHMDLRNADRPRIELALCRWWDPTSFPRRLSLRRF